MTSRRYLRERTGFVLLAVLWLLVSLATLTLALSFAGRDAVAAAQNRMSLAQADWHAEGCVELVRGVATEALLDSLRAGASWRTLDDVVTRSPLIAESACDVTLSPGGATLDANTANGEQLRRVFFAMHVLPGRADSLVDALLDWRDTDDQPRQYGAERAWYQQAHGFRPRNGAIGNARELARIRGFNELPGIDSLLGVEPGRVLLGRAPLPVLAALPGFLDETVARIDELRARDALPGTLLELTGALSPSARDSLAAHYAELVPLVTMVPDVWVVTARGRVSASPVVATVEVRLARARNRMVVVRHRSWS